MNINLESKLFTSKISRRIFTYFALCSIIPVAFALIIIHFQFSSYLIEHTYDGMNDAVKSQSKVIYDHLIDIENKLKLVCRSIEKQDERDAFVVSDNVKSLIAQEFKSLSLLSDSNQLESIYKQFSVRSLSFSSDEISHMSSSHTLLKVLISNQSVPVLIMSRMLNGNDSARGFLNAEISFEKLLGKDYLLNLPKNTDSIIFDSFENILVSTNPFLEKSISDAQEGLMKSISGNFTLNYDGEEHFAAYSQLYLKPKFLYPNLTIFQSKSRQNVFSPLNKYKYYSALFVIFTMMIAILLSIVSIRKSMIPIGMLREVAKRISKGDFNIKSDIHSNDEFEYLGNAFDIAVQELKDHQQKTKQAQKALKIERDSLEEKVKDKTAKLSETNRMLKNEINIKNTVEKKLVEARLQADEANQAKSEFLANMSHELRTPLNHIIGFTELVLNPQFGELSEIQKDYLKDVHESSHHLLSLINDILDLSKVEAGKFELEPSFFDLSELIERCLTMVKEKAMKHSIQLNLENNCCSNSISADERKLKQIMYNLLSNAVKFTPEGGKITVKVQGNDEKEVDRLNGGRDFNGDILISVSDTGVGLKPEDIDRVFNPFEQVNNTMSKQTQGTGLGLQLTKKFVELHGGKIWVESEGEGKGATFTFSIPDSECSN